MARRKKFVRAAKKTFKRYAVPYEVRSRDFIKKYLKPAADNFLMHVGGKKILDIGSGPGRDAAYFRSKYFQPVCIDASEEMVKLCKKKKLKAMVMDYTDLNFLPESFHGVWSYTSLQYVSPKILFRVLKKIHRILKPGGIFFIGLSEGTVKEWVSDKKFPGTKRYRATYTEQGLRQLLSFYFEVISAAVITVPVPAGSGTKNY